MSGILYAGPALGITVMPLTFASLISAHGWRVSYIVLGGIVLVITVLAAQFLRRDPEKMGLVPYGAQDVPADGSNLQAEGCSFREAVRTRQFWLLNTVSFCEVYMENVLVVHIVIHATGLGIPTTLAASILSVGAAVSIPARIVMGGIADIIGNKRALGICYAMSVVAFLLLLVARELWLFYLFAALFGAGSWASSSIRSPLTADLFGLKAHGTIFACTALATGIGGAVGPVLAGYIFDVTGSYQLAFISCTAVAITGLLSIISLKPVTKTQD